MRGWIIFCAVPLICCASGVAAAEPAPICADRPGKATSTCTVPTGLRQVELGVSDWTLQKGGTDRVTSLSLGETTVKYGLTDASDLEVDVTPWQRASVRAGNAHHTVAGIGDVAILYKQRMTSADAALAVTVKPFVKVPTATRALGNGKVEAGLLVPIGYSIPKTPLSLALTPELDWAADADGHGHHASMAQVASLGWALSDRLNLTGELWEAWDWDPSGTTRQASADGAMAYLVTNNLQLDAGANFGLNHVTADVELYGGVSVRF